jgi:hypothetical protein
MKLEILIISLTIIAVAGAFICGYLYNPNFITEAKSELSNIDNLSICENNTLSESSRCLKDYVKTFYNYNLSEKNNEYNLTRIKELGGVCWQYARFYKDNLESLGFKAKTVDFFGNESGHTITLAWNDKLSEYCELDQLNINCVKLDTNYKNETK